MAENKQRGKAFFQIILPLLAMIVAMGAGIYFLVFDRQATLESINQSGDIAAIYLLFLAAPPIFMTMAVLIFLILINRKTKHSLQSVFPNITHKIEQANHTIRGHLNNAVKPFVESEAQIRALRQTFSKKGKNGK